MNSDRSAQVNDAVAAVLRAEAAAQKTTAKKLAAELDMPASTMATYFNGSSPIPLARLDLIATALGMDLLEVVRRAYDRLA